MLKRIIVFLLFAVVMATAEAKIKLPQIISDNMVLQQLTDVKLWGKAEPYAKVTVRPSWTKKKYVCDSDSAGNWLVRVATPAAGYEPRTITFSDGEKISVKNVLIGEVWFCSGQSNMEMPVHGFSNCPLMDANETVATANRYKGKLRTVKIGKGTPVTPQDTCTGKWDECTPETAFWFTAVGFHFAASIHAALDVPVGIINSSWGGSTVEGWLDRETLETYPDVDLSAAGNPKVHPMYQPMIMYNGMIKPLVNYTIRGFLWYQGESNVPRYETYAARQADMVKLWRKEWGLGNLPFYYVEIAPYGYSFEGNKSAYLREQQFKAQAMIPNSGMVGTNDLVEPYEEYNIHPKNKTQIGQRLSYLALTNDYGFKHLYCYGPSFQSLEIKDGKAKVKFDNAPDGFNRREFDGFEIAGEDRVFYPAKAVTVSNDRLVVVVSSEQVKEPVAVRYCFKDFRIGNMANVRELPAIPFRTDNW